MMGTTDQTAALFTPPPPAPARGRLRVAVLVSGSGTTLQNLIDEVRRGRLRIEIALVISSHSEAYALERARNAGISTRTLCRTDFSTRALFSAACFEASAEAGAGLIAMAGFLQKLEIPAPWLGRVLNIHPSLLPAFGGKGFYGDRVHRAVLEYGCKVSGCTVHVADNAYDRGPVLLQRAVPVLKDDSVETLQTRVFHEECLAYPQAIRLMAEGRIRFYGRQTLIAAPNGSAPARRHSASVD
jgi:formyltetrahydrofolate-dependent phosphoribosylglycinamide formyltransferase